MWILLSSLVLGLSVLVSATDIPNEGNCHIDADCRPGHRCKDFSNHPLMPRLPPGTVRRICALDGFTPGQGSGMPIVTDGGPPPTQNPWTNIGTGANTNNPWSTGNNGQSPWVSTNTGGTWGTNTGQNTWGTNTNTVGQNQWGNNAGQGAWTNTGGQQQPFGANTGNQWTGVPVQPQNPWDHSDHSWTWDNTIWGSDTNIPTPQGQLPQGNQNQNTWGNNVNPNNANTWTGNGWGANPNAAGTGGNTNTWGNTGQWGTAGANTGVVSQPWGTGDTTGAASAGHGSHPFPWSPGSSGAISIGGQTGPFTGAGGSTSTGSQTIPWTDGSMSSSTGTQTNPWSNGGSTSTGSQTNPWSGTGNSGNPWGTGGNTGAGAAPWGTGGQVVKPINTGGGFQGKACSRKLDCPQNQVCCHLPACNGQPSKQVCDNQNSCFSTCGVSYILN